MQHALSIFATLAVLLAASACMSQTAKAKPESSPTEALNIELVRYLDAEGGFVRLEDGTLFLTSDLRKEQPGYWFDAGPAPLEPALLCDALPGAWDVAVDGGYALVCDYEKHLPVYRIQDGDWTLIKKLDMPSMTENVLIRGKLAYVANHTAGMTIVNFSNPDSPSILSNYNPEIDCDAIAIWEDTAILYGHWESRLVLIDIREPNNLRKAGVYQNAPKTFNQGELAVHNGIAYCTALTGLVIVDIRNPAAPKLAKDLQLGGATTDVVAMDEYAFVAAGRQGVLVFDIHDPARPTRVGCYRSRGKLVAAQVAVQPLPSDDGARGSYVIYAANKKGPAMVLHFQPVPRTK